MNYKFRRNIYSDITISFQCEEACKNYLIICDHLTRQFYESIFTIGSSY